MNHQPAEPDDKVYENFIVEYIKRPEEAAVAEDVSQEDPVDAEGYPEERTDSKASVTEDNNLQEASKDEAKKTEQQSPCAMTVIVNKTPVTLTGKSEYMFVDVFDFYPFDLTTVRGKRLITNIDGSHAEFIQTLHEGAVVDIYWEQ